MACGNSIGSYKRQTGENEFALLVGLSGVGLVHTHVRPKHVDVRLAERNLLTIGLLYPNFATQFSRLRGAGCGRH